MSDIKKLRKALREAEDRLDEAKRVLLRKTGWNTSATHQDAFGCGKRSCQTVAPSLPTAKPPSQFRQDSMANSDELSTLELALDAAYARYSHNANANKLPMVWSYQEWLDHSEVAKRIINENYTPG